MIFARHHLSLAQKICLLAPFPLILLLIVMVGVFCVLYYTKLQYHALEYLAGELSIQFSKCTYITVTLSIERDSIRFYGYKI